MVLFGLTASCEHGGLGLRSSEEIEVIMELTWSSAAFRSIVGINLGLGSQALLIDGTPDQQAEWLPRIATGEVIVSFCLTEPGSGSDSAALITSAVRDGDDYLLSGTKRFITNAPLAGLFLVMARTSRERLPKNAHIRDFLVPADAEGIAVGKIEQKMGQSGAWISDGIFKNVRVRSEERRVGKEVGSTCRIR